MIPALPTRPLVYVAGPYRHDEREVMDARIVGHQQVMCRLAEAGMVPYSPIAMWGPCAHKELSSDIESSFTFWMEQDLPILAKCDLMLVCPFPGWNHSEGTAREISFAQENHIPIAHFVNEAPFIGVVPIMGVGAYRNWPILRIAKGHWYLVSCQEYHNTALTE